MKTSKKESRHPLFGSSLRIWIQLITDNGGIDLNYLNRAFFITFFIIIMWPLRLLSNLLYNKIIKETKIKYPPIFIIGHWRSGTTFLHELISRDPQLAHVSLWHTIVPNSFLILDKFKPFLKGFLPSTRPMDSMKVDIDGPYEDEAGLAALCRWSFFHCLIFPKNAEKQYQQSILFNELSKIEIEVWKEKFKYLLKAVTYENKGKRLILKNPAHTARINTLLELFPNAIFIHIYRNPYNVYASTKKLRTRVLGPFALQNTTLEDIEKHVTDDYIRLMEKFFEQKKNIPENQYIEFSYEDFIGNPMKHIRYIYKKFNLTSLKEAEPEMKKHLDSQKDYKPNVHKFDGEIIKKVGKYWDFTIKKWAYKPPESK